MVRIVARRSDSALTVRVAVVVIGVEVVSERGPVVHHVLLEMHLGGRFGPVYVEQVSLGVDVWKLAAVTHCRTTGSKPMSVTCTR